MAQKRLIHIPRCSADKAAGGRSRGGPIGIQSRRMKSDGSEIAAGATEEGICARELSVIFCNDPDPRCRPAAGREPASRPCLFAPTPPLNRVNVADDGAVQGYSFHRTLVH